MAVWAVWFKCTRIDVCMFVRIHVSCSVCASTYVCAHVYVCMYVRTYTYVWMYMHPCGREERPNTRLEVVVKQIYVLRYHTVQAFSQALLAGSSILICTANSLSTQIFGRVTS